MLLRIVNKNSFLFVVLFPLSLPVSLWIPGSQPGDDVKNEQPGDDNKKHSPGMTKKQAALKVT